MYEDLKLEFNGFDPGAELKKIALLAAEKLQLASPSDSALKVVLKKGQDAVEASCKVASKAGNFVAETVSDSPVCALRDIEEKLKTQLEEWKKRRFGGTDDVT